MKHVSRELVLAENVTSGSDVLGEVTPHEEEILLGLARESLRVSLQREGDDGSVDL